MLSDGEPLGWALEGSQGGERLPSCASRWEKQKVHYPINVEMFFFFCAKHIHTPFTPSEAVRLVGTQNDVLTACCPVSINISSH